MSVDDELKETASHDAEKTFDGSEIAIVGMACRFPGAHDPEEFWHNLRAGVESLTELSDEELTAAGVDPEQLQDPAYVRRVPVVDGVEDFDPAFFGYTVPEATIMDPQQRLFLECAWEAFEQAGYDPADHPRPVGVFTGAKTNTYLFNLIAQRSRFPGLDNFQMALYNDLGSTATWVSYKLDLRGPSYAVHTACSTSMVAVHLACQSLLLDECAVALAGGASINFPQHRGYVYQEGGLLSPDGSCRTFSAEAAGTAFGNGVGAVLLKRLEDAITDGDHVHAVIRGSATNNDGARKASFTAPSLEGQTNVVLEALACAGVEADELSYVEAHGTATPLGDSIEILALTQAFRASTRRRGFCAVGTVKTNIGHVENAAGVAGLIKTALALEHREVPPSLHCETPNPEIDFAGSPFYVNTRLTPWPAPPGGGPRRAGVSSFGVGSTNAHVILEEAPRRPPSEASEGWRPLLLSARSESALAAMAGNLARHLREHPELDLADVAYTLQVGRRRFAHRRAVVCRSREDAAVRLGGEDGDPGATLVEESTERPVVFLLPGLGDHRLDLARGLYESEPTFRATFDRAVELLEPLIGEDLRPTIYPPRPVAEEPEPRRLLRRDGPRDESSRRLDETRRAQPLLFALEYALARMWMAWGVEPRAMIGYSLGEYVAACLAGVLSLEDALTLVARRAQLIHELEAGAMLGVSLSEEELAPLLGDALSPAAVNGPGLSVAAGPVPAVEELEARLTERGVACRRLATTHAFHSRMMEPITEAVTEVARGLTLHRPEIPYVSNVTGTWITAEEATDPRYWARHMCRPVRFADGVATLLADGEPAMLEMGSGQSLCSFVKLHPACDTAQAARVLPSLPGALESRDDARQAAAALGRLWLHGATVDWQAHYSDRRRRRVPLPTYPFERRRCWVDLVPETEPTETSGTHVTLDKKEDLAEWFYLPVWQPARQSAARQSAARQPAARQPAARQAPACTLVLSDGGSLAAALAARLREAGGTVVELTPAHGGEAAGAGLSSAGPDRYALDPGRPEAYVALLEELSRGGRAAGAVVHLWSLAAPESYEASQEHGFFSLLALAQALGKTPPARTEAGGPVTITAVTHGLHRITGDETLRPENATILGPGKVIPQELAGVACRTIDVVVPEPASAAETELVGQLFAELGRSADPGETLAYRDGRRFEQGFEPVRLEEPEPSRLRQGGTYLVTGGLGGLGLVLAEHLARTCRARLVLVGRSAFPAPETWSARLAENGTDALGAKIRTLTEMEAAGAEVLVLRADVAERGQMAAVREAALARFGTLDGVVHAAGIPGGGIIQLKTPAAAREILRPKVEGARVLAEVFGDLELDFMVLYSSVASLLGEFGQVDYCAANAFLDAFAVSCAAAGVPVTTVNWDMWQEVGLAVYTEVPPRLEAWRREMLAKAIRPCEGVRVFERVLTCEAPQVVVSTQDLPGRIELGKSFTGERFLAELGLDGSGAAAAAPRKAAAPGPGRPRERPALERRLAEIWQQVLGLEQVRVADNFFDLGGNSLIALQLVNVLNRELGLELSPVELFERPTVEALARHLSPEQEDEAGAPASGAGRRGEDDEIAIVGMAGRFPGAPSVEELWQNLHDGVESVRFFTDEELTAAGVSPQLLADPNYVRAGAVLDGIDLFDAGLFGYSPREAEVMDPQQRIFLECAWEALETAGCDSRRYGGRIGVFAGSNLSTYLLRLYADPEVAASLNMLQAILGNDKDALTTRVSYKLDLKGPSVAVQTFCSTSLVAVHMAAKSLLGGDCDMALAGGIRVVVPAEQGYLYEERGISPRDGHTRSFDAKATGSLLGHGVGVVVLKRLADALADRDPIRAVIKGSAINNDGAGKAGYTAPSVEGQVRAARDALRDAGVDPATISYLEAHGSATDLGDPIEVVALARAYSSSAARPAPCALGSVKSNFGHLDRAAGVTGLIKTVLALEHRQIPPSLNFEEPNPQIDFDASPFRVVDALTPWETNAAPRRAGVNSLGIGGTNVHVVLEEAPEREEPAAAPARPRQLLVLSAESPRSLERATSRLAEHLETRVSPPDPPQGGRVPPPDPPQGGRVSPPDPSQGSRPDESLEDVAYTLQVGRRQLRLRRMLVCRDTADAVAGLKGEGGSPRLVTGYREEGERSVVFLFPGLGGQYVDMARGLYENEPVFRDAVDRCAEILEPLLGTDLRELIYPEPSSAPAPDGSEAKLDLRRLLRGAEDGDSEAARRLDRTAHAQPALFVVEYALARLWLHWGIRPGALLGYSIGEYVAACLAGVLSLADALSLVTRRAQLIEALPAGGMLAVAMTEEALAPLLAAEPELSLAAVNNPEQTVVAGPAAALDAFAERLDQGGVSWRRLRVSHAFHSAMLEAASDELTELVRGFELQTPRIPCVSNLTGTWMRDEDATDPSYWARHMCAPVRFSDGLATVLESGERVMLEVGPQALSSIVLQHPASVVARAEHRPSGEAGPGLVVLASLRHALERRSDTEHLLGTLGKLWLTGVEVDWRAFHGAAERRLVVLPTYPFDRQRYWIETRDARTAAPVAAENADRRPLPEPGEEETPDGVLGTYARPDLRVEYVAPSSDTERAVAEIWQDLLGVERVGIHDNFLELGGDSLLASRLLVRLRDVFHMDLPIRLLFEASTVAELVRAVEDRRQEEARRQREEEEGEVQALLREIRELPEEILELEIAKREGDVHG